MTPRWSRGKGGRGVVSAAAEMSRGEAGPQEPAAQRQPQQPEAVAAAEQAPAADSLQELTAMAESLLAQATDLRRQTQLLADELAERASEEEVPDGPPTETFDAVEPAEAAQQAPQEPEPEADPVSGMRIVAVNMAAAGRTREDAADYLRQTFGEEPDPALLDEVFAGDTGQAG
jgi:hypothetical protein